MLKIHVIDSSDKNFPLDSTWDFRDFIVWLHHKMLPQHFVFELFGKYWRVCDGDCVCNGDEKLCAPAFAVYRERLGVTQDDETKGRILSYIATHSDLRYRTIAHNLGISNAGVGYHIADLAERGIVETDPICLTEIGEMALSFINKE